MVVEYGEEDHQGPGFILADQLQPGLVHTVEQYIQHVVVHADNKA
ncbi:hypothetical protein OG625_00310 [Streptomyces sp. NBC_01351]|nr:hypothetical protein [Streptomyces sp. NBC_01351]